MKTCTVLILVFCLTFISLNKAICQTPADKDQDIEKVVVGTNEVVLDAVVKDKKGRAIKDLTAADFEISEDGVPQEVRSFRLVTREQATAGGPNADSRPISLKPSADAKNSPAESTKAPKSSGPQTPLNSPTHFGALALVFDRLSPNARSIARQASLSYVDGMRQDDFVGVFGIDLSLRVLQRFTNDENKIKAAVERGLSHSSSSYASATDQISDLQNQQGGLQSQVDTGTQGAGAGSDPSAGVGAAAAQQQFNAMTLNIAQGFERMEHNQQGTATIDGLLAIIDGMKNLPGRKAMIFFSEGITLPTSVMSHFRSVISNANRANVSIYAVDAAGLRAESSDSQAGRALTRLGQARARTAGSNSDPFGSMMQDLERNEDLMRSNPDSALGDLANETGGALISNTNEPGPRLRQVDEDLHSYYLLTYTPKNSNYDGRFRQISIKVNRSSVDVQARRGYYALNNSYGTPVLDYEAPALAILSEKPRPNAFESRAAAYSFPESGQPGLVPVVVEVPAGAVNYAVDDRKKTFIADFSFVVLIKDASQHVVKKLSNQEVIKGPLDKLAKAKAGGMLFYREANLDPGQYAIAAVVYDNMTHQASMNTGMVTVPPADQAALRLSSIVVVRKAERPTAGQQALRTFQFADMLVYPNLGEPVSKAAGNQLTLFVTVYTAKGDTTAPKLSLEIDRAGRSVGHLSYDLHAPDQTGRIQYASVISLDKFQPGDYDLKLTVRAGANMAARSEHVRLTP
jgi:VWFA-related protein